MYLITLYHDDSALYCAIAQSKVSAICYADRLISPYLVQNTERYSPKLADREVYYKGGCSFYVIVERVEVIDEPH